MLIICYNSCFTLSLFLVINYFVLFIFRVMFYVLSVAFVVFNDF